MSAPGHTYTPEPWVADRQTVRAGEVCIRTQLVWGNGPDFEAAAEVHTANARRIAACVNACEGIPTEQLEAMTRAGTGALAAAYDACSGLWESFGEGLTNDEPIAGCDAVDALCLVAHYIESATAWARDQGETP